MVENKLSILSQGDIADELQKQSKKRTKIAVIFLLAVVSDWILSFAVPILTGRAPLTIEATFISFVLIIFYMAFVGIEKLHQRFDMDTVKKWLEISELMNMSSLSEIRANEMASLDIEQRKMTMQLRDEKIRDIIEKGTSMFSVQGDSPAQRSDWLPMTDAFVKIIKDIDNQLLYNEMKESALVILEEKLPALRESMETLLKHMQSLEEREKKRDELIQKSSIDFNNLKSKVNFMEKRIKK